MLVLIKFICLLYHAGMDLAKMDGLLMGEGYGKMRVEFKENF